MDIRFPDPVVQEVFADVLAILENARLSEQLVELAKTPSGVRTLSAATIAIASALLLAKTAMPQEETRFLAAARTQLSPVRADARLVEYAFALIAADSATENDVFRDRKLITDEVFEKRLAAIRQTLQH
jgi:hypothetical protein